MSIVYFKEITTHLIFLSILKSKLFNEMNYTSFLSENSSLLLLLYSLFDTRLSF